MRSVVNLIFWLCISLGAPVLIAGAADEPGAVELPKAEDLSALADMSQRQQVPILLMYSAKDCDYCNLLEKEVLRPMMISGELNQKVVFRKVMVDSAATIKDFQGQRIEIGDFAFNEGVQVTPTLQLVDEDGNQLVPKLIGYQGTDFYSAYLDLAIAGSKEILSKR